MKVAIQGIAGSFHEEAAGKLIAKKFDILPCETFQLVFEAVLKNQVEYGVVAVENSLHGSINTVYRLLANKNLWVGGEIYLHINQYLIAHAPIEPNQINTKSNIIFSQAPALAQCEEWLDAHLPNASREELHDTAESVKFIVKQQNPHYAAVASKKAAELYNGHIIAGPINDDPHNYTRFFLLSKNPATPQAANKTSIILTTSHRPGALYQALGVFAELDINLSKLDSHPIAGDKWHYAFYIDFDCNISDDLAVKAVKKLKDQDCVVTVLGSYLASALPL